MQNSLGGALGAPVQPAVALLLHQQGDHLPLGEGQQGAVGAGGLVGHARPRRPPTCRPADSHGRRSCGGKEKLISELIKAAAVWQRGGWVSGGMIN